MNLLIFCSTFYPYTGGAESLFEDLASIFSQRGHQVTVLTRSRANLAADEKRNGIHIVRADYPFYYMDFRCCFAFLKRSLLFLKKAVSLLKKNQTQAVCVGLFDLGVLYLLLLSFVMKFKLIIYLHGGELRKGIRDSKLYRLVFSLCLKRCDAVIAVSQALKREVIQFAPFVEKKVRVIPNGIDFLKIKQAPHAYSGKNLLCVGRLEPVKNIETMIRAFARVCHEIPDNPLWIIGDGTQENELKRIVSALGLGKRIFFLGALERGPIFSMMKEAAFVLLPSYAEGFPIVVLEALGAGKMVIGSRVKGITEIIEEGKNGVLFDPRNEEELAGLILKYATDTLSRSRFEEFIENMDLTPYDIQKLADEHLAVIEGREAISSGESAPSEEIPFEQEKVNR